MSLLKEDFLRSGHRAVDLASAYLSELPNKPVFQRMTEEERQALTTLALPAKPLPGEEILALISRRLLPHPMGNGHPRFFGWVNSPPCLMAVATEILAAAMNPSCAGGDHAAIYLERCVIGWLMQLMDFPSTGSSGLLVSGASAASITALAAARHACLKARGVDVRRQGVGAHALRLYASNQTHSCIQKAVELLGLGSDSIRWIDVDDHFRVRPDRLSSAVQADVAQGLAPFCIVGNAGTVNTGAVDPLDELSEIAGHFRVWLHVDGAYGAFGKLAEIAAPIFAGLENADSLALDAHKWLGVPVECGCILVRDGHLLRETFSLVPPYLRSEPGKGAGNLPWFSEYGMQQTRGFRALKLWVTLLNEGRDGLCRRIARQIALARSLERRIQATPEMELSATGPLSIVCFRCRPAALESDTGALNAFNQVVMETVQAEGVVFLTSAVLDGCFFLRACILHPDTSEQDFDTLILEVLRVSAVVLNRGKFQHPQGIAGQKPKEEATSL